MELIRHDVRFALRTARKYRANTAIAIATLAIGIGATTAIYSAAEVFLFRPLTLPNLERLVVLSQSVPPNTTAWTELTPGLFSDLKEHSGTFDGIAAYRWTSASLTGAGEPQRLRGLAVSANLFSVIEARPQAGRTFRMDEETPGRDQAVILSHALWVNRFGSDTGVIGSRVELNGLAFTVVGVMPADFQFLPGAEFWRPLALAASEWHDRKQTSLLAVARLKSSVTVGQAASRMEVVARTTAAQYFEAGS